MPKLGLRLVFSTDPQPYLLNISSLLYDIELLHDFSLLLSEGGGQTRLPIPKYCSYEFPRSFWYRNGRPIYHQHKIRIAEITKGSPFTVELVFAGITVASGAFWLMLQALEKIQNWKINRKKLKLEVDHLSLKIAMEEFELEEEIRAREKREAGTRARAILNSLIRRLESNPINLESMEIVVLPIDEPETPEGEMELDAERYRNKG
jgi:hypothetical protein